MILPVRFVKEIQILSYKLTLINYIWTLVEQSGHSNRHLNIYIVYFGIVYDEPQVLKLTVTIIESNTGS